MDCLIGGVDYASAVGFVGRGFDWGVDGERYGSPTGNARCARHHFECAIDGYRYHGQMEFHGQLIGAFVEGAHFTGKCA